MECNSCTSTWELALDCNTSQSTIYHPLKKTGKVSKLGIWVPHTLSETNKEDHISIVTILLRQRNDPFLKNIITDDKNGLFMTMFNAKKLWIDEDESLWSTPWVEFYGRKLMLCMVGSVQYYLFWVFKLQLHSQCRLSICMKIFLEDAPHSSIGETCFSMIMPGHIQQESHRKKYWILAGLFYPIHYIHQTLH